MAGDTFENDPIKTPAIGHLALDLPTLALGSSITGADARELLHIFVPLMHKRANARGIVDAEFAHPFAEMMQDVNMSLARCALD